MFVGYTLDDKIPPDEAFDFTKEVKIVTVTSDTEWNPCGHTMLFVNGYYFHIAQFSGLPYWFPKSDLNKVLKRKDGNGFNRIIHVEEVHNIPNPEGSKAFLIEQMKSVWNFMLVINNCVTFIKRVLGEGGLKVDGLFNCPLHFPPHLRNH